VRKEVRREGTPFTRRRVESEKVDLNEDDPAEIAQAFRSLTAFGKAPWSANAALLERIEADLALEIARKGSVSFEPRAELGWYLKQLSMYAKMVTANAAKGDVEWVAHAAAHWGMLWAELELWQARGETFEKGLVYRRNGQASRRGDDRETRIAAVDALVEGGMKKGAAIAAVAERQGVGAKAVETDYYKGDYKGKRPKAVD